MINSVQSNTKIPAQGSHNTAGNDSSVFDVNQFLYNDDPLFDTSFEGILDSPLVYPENGIEIESDVFRPVSPPISRAQYSSIDRSEKRHYSQLKPAKAHCDFTPVAPQTSHSVLSSDSSYEYEQPTTPYNIAYMTPNATFYQSAINKPVCRPHSAEPVKHELFHSPIPQDQLLYPNSEYTCHNHSCPHHVTTHSTPVYPAARCNSKYVRLPVDSCECPYSPVVNRRGVPQPNVSKVNLTPNQISCVRPPPSVDQFNTPTPGQKMSKRINYIQNFSPNDLSLQNCVNCTTPVCRNCGCGNVYPETRASDSFTTISSQGQFDSCISTQEGISYDQEESIFSSQLSCSQTPIVSDTSSQLTDPSSLEGILPETHISNKEEYLRNRKRKEEKKRNSERERIRIQQINKAFKDLGDVCCFHMKERAQSKVATIEQALVLIQKLQNQIAQKKASESDSPTLLP